jgi:hypothetical protein
VTGGRRASHLCVMIHKLCSFSLWPISKERRIVASDARMWERHREVSRRVPSWLRQQVVRMLGTTHDVAVLQSKNT